MAVALAMAATTAPRRIRHHILKRMSTTFQKMCLSSSSRMRIHEDGDTETASPRKWPVALHNLKPHTKWTLYEDYTYRGLKEKVNDDNRQSQIEEQRLNIEQQNSLGPDLYVSDFVVKRGGKVKVKSYPEWFDRDMPLPPYQLDNFQVEGLDLTGTQLVYEGYENLVNLEHLKYVRVSDNDLFNDFCLTQFVHFRHSLEFLHISNCPKVTERGLAWLHHLENLKGLRLENLRGVEDPEVVLYLVGDMLPNCKVLGTIGSSDPEVPQQQPDHTDGHSTTSS